MQVYLSAGNKLYKFDNTAGLHQKNFSDITHVTGSKLIKWIFSLEKKKLYIWKHFKFSRKRRSKDISIKDFIPLINKSQIKKPFYSITNKFLHKGIIDIA